MQDCISQFFFAYIFPSYVSYSCLLAFFVDWYRSLCPLTFKHIDSGLIKAVTFLPSKCCSVDVDYIDAIMWIYQSYFYRHYFRRQYYKQVLIDSLFYVPLEVKLSRQLTNAVSAKLKYVEKI